MDDIASLYAELSPLMSPLWENIKGVANSSFTTSLAGAFAGAIAAQRIAEKGKFREELVKEFQSTNSAIALAISVTSVALALKKQHINDLKSSYDADQKNFKAHKAKIENGQIAPNTPIKIKPNLLFLQGISPPIAKIQDIVLSRLSAVGRTIASVTALADAVENLNGALSKRNELLNSFKNNHFPEGATFADMYLGLQYQERHTNEEYGGSIKAISLYTDDVIFFSIKLYDDLQDHSATLTRRYKSRLRGAPPRASTADFEKPRQNGLIPKDEDYVDWLSGFVSVQEPNYKWWQRMNLKGWFN
ncbi:hypothetical protein IBA8401_47270 [Pseudomonas syringae]|uniref:hypothetical protein n=1 Tax=Pseudomonas syringae group TaxID=136849 RepID=UPI0022A7951F|nr:hypothetical protein [Pseudomonas syringae group genomosp. 3]MCZ0950211.1 hypothetical protein [Pseudomonas syringae pv. tomato]